MKVNRTKAGTYTITGITKNQYNALRTILTTDDDRCFDEANEDGDYYSNDDFVCTLTKEEREALRQLCKSL
ncbi:hypothetical protein KML24007_03960 [Alistipes indistinctus]|uniref:hypothetical protein n=1 Tax=Alistipes indistinctus TaxID=626932 RepID=UPI0036F1E9C8